MSNRKLYLNLPSVGREQNNEMTYICPICQKPKLGWNTIRHFGQCFYCDRGYNDISIKRICTINYMQSFAEDMNLDLEDGKAEPKKPKYEFERMSHGNVEQIEARCFLMADKHLLPAVIDNNIYYSPSTREVGVQIRNIATPMPNSWIRRSIDRKGWFVDAGIAKDQHLFYVPGKFQFPQGEIIYLVEGVFDALSLSPWASAVALLGTKLYPAQLKWLKGKVKNNNGLPVFVWMDPDKAGQKAATEILFQLRYQAGIPCMVLMENNEPNDLDHEILGEMVLSGVKAYVDNKNTNKVFISNPYTRRN